MSSPFMVLFYGPKNGPLFWPTKRVVGTRSMKSNRTNGPNLRTRKKEKRKETMAKLRNSQGGSGVEMECTFVTEGRRAGEGAAAP